MEGIGPSTSSLSVIPHPFWIMISLFVGMEGIEPSTSSLSVTRSTTELHAQNIQNRWGTLPLSYMPKSLEYLKLYTALKAKIKVISAAEIKQ